MTININELEGRGIAASVAGGAFLGGTVYEGGISFVQSTGSIDPTLYGPDRDLACLSGLLFLAAVGVILRVNSRSRLIDDQPAQDYPNVNA